MLPTNPRTGVRGLPTNPRPHSRSTGRETSARETSYPPPSSRQGRRTQPPPHSPQVSTSSRTSANRLQSHSPRKSNGSISSSGSSLLGRIKPGATYTSESSRTSLEDGYQPHSDAQLFKRDESSTSFGGSKEHSVTNHSQGGEQSTFAFNVGDGPAIWTRMATVASTLTVSVSKAWASNVPMYSGEETPPGQESRLVRAMKAYHLAKAKDPTDLPSWLFDESVRQRPTPISTSIDTKDDYQTRQRSPNHISKPRGLRDVYDAATSSPSIPTLGTSRGRHINDMEEPSKAANRLKAIREAKRSALTANAAPRHLPDAVDEHQTVARNYDDKHRIDRRTPHLGLPPGPRRM